MNNFTSKFMLLLGLAAAPLAFAAKATTIKLRTDSRTIEIPYDADSTEISLELGETARSVEIVNAPYEMEVVQLFETSVTLQDEGPHWDMTDWKHNYSESFGLEKIKRRFNIMASTSDESFLPAPKVTTTELVDELVRTHAPERWVNLAKSCKSLTTYPCAVGTSRIILHISKKTGLDNETTKKVILTLPMGC